MSSSKLHPSLPAPVVHHSYLSTSNSKSSVLAGVQDAYWSDDEAEDSECPLCLEEMDVSDANFKPCPCGYQICRFCWHHIKENLNRRCPACRREYTDEAVQFKPIDKEDHRKLTQQKKQREKERKDLDHLGRRHLLNVRIVQRNVVYVVGLGSRFGKEELIPTLRSNEYFGRYGKITKILLVKRNAPGSGPPVVGLYISYYRREDAARAIAEVDGTVSPSGGGDVMRASYGTTKYCIAFLRNVSCSNKGCMDLHDWGDEKDCFTKEDLTTLKHSMKDAETTHRASPLGKKVDDGMTLGNLPKSAAWGQKSALTSAPANVAVSSLRDTSRNRRGHRSVRSGVSSEAVKTAGSSRTQQDRKIQQSSTKTPSQASSSRPSTPAPASLPQRPVTPSTSAKQHAKAKRDALSHNPPPVPQPPRSPTSSVVDSDVGSASQDASASPAMSPLAGHVNAVSTILSPPSVPAAPPGLPAVPPGLSTTAAIAHGTPPPGLTQSAQSSLSREPSSSSYQMSSQAQALLDDMKIRREASISASNSFVSPFPDLDRTLQVLSIDDGDNGGFNFNLDPKLAVDDEHFDALIPDLDSGLSSFDPFASLRTPLASSPFGVGPPPGLSTASSRSFFDATNKASVPQIDRQSSTSSAYTGSFNPFGESVDTAVQSAPSRPSATIDDDLTRRVSRFGFARERQGSGFSMTSSPMIGSDASLSEGIASATSSHAPWPFQRPTSLSHELVGPPPGLPVRGNTPASTSVSRGSPLVSQAFPAMNTSPSVQAVTSRFQPFDNVQGDAALKDMLGIGRERPAVPTEYRPTYAPGAQSQPFMDPAIMSSAPFLGLQPLDTSFTASPSLPSGTAYSPRLGYMRSPTQSFAQAHNPAHPPDGSMMGYMDPQLQMVDPATSFSMSHIMEGQSPIVPLAPADSTQESPSPPPVLSPTDFPALPTAASDPMTRPKEVTQPHILPSKDEKEQARIDRRVAKKIAAAERAAEKERESAEKAAAEKERKEKAREEKEKAREEKERLAKEKREKAERERIEKEKEKERLAVERAAQKEQNEKAKGKKGKGAAKEETQQTAGASNATASPAKASKAAAKAQVNTTPVAPIVEPSPMPMLSKMPKKNKPVTKPIRTQTQNHKEEDSHDSHSALPSATSKSNASTPQVPNAKIPSVSHSAAQSEDGISNAVDERESAHSTIPTRPKSLKELLHEIDVASNGIHLPTHPFFDIQRLVSLTKAPMDSTGLLKALSTFPTDCASGVLDDKTMASFRQLLETLTQTMSDLVQLLPQTTWGTIFDKLSQDLKNLKLEYSAQTSSSFDGLVIDDLADGEVDGEDDYDGEEDSERSSSPVDRRARWMELQLAKLEELHRDVNAAAIRAILHENDSGSISRSRQRPGAAWGTVLPHVGNTLARFDQLGMVIEDGQKKRHMNGDELEKKLLVAKEAVVFAETELKEAMQALKAFMP
ncbi:hypothetical protein SCHPADRAFT_832227 [Schizopora paradoxa]|uniref:RING-type domain-containing protein n=1 Tax=Schizopora paradoxa TaxID=27342 RepID=A0A0H2RGE3_9AGAM|nr:hypothetical protein SCHPADRAFT_832227 [Schizopora paradoxa]